MKDLQLIRKIAWSFHKTTNLDIEDLIQEAALEYCEKRGKFTPDRGAKFSTFIWNVIYARLIDYEKQYRKYHNPLISTEELIVEEKTIETSMIFEHLTEEGQKVLEIVLASPKKFIGSENQTKKQRIEHQKYIERRLTHILSRKGWDKKKVKRAIINIKEALSL